MRYTAEPESNQATHYGVWDTVREEFISRGWTMREVKALVQDANDAEERMRSEALAVIIDDEGNGGLTPEEAYAAECGNPWT